MEIGPLAIKALETVRGLSPTASNLTRASREYGAETARWAFEQWDLRRRAQSKFARAEQMLFDRDGLEMASHEAMARFHAAQFPPDERVADLTCGIGADLIALARENPAVGFEIDPDRAAMARHNLEVHQVRSEVVGADCLEANWDFEYAFADPARRSGKGRTLDPDDFQPRLDALVERMSTLKLGLIKVSAMLPDEVLRRYGKRVDFLSYDWECREAILRVGSEPFREDPYWAAKVDSGEWLTEVTEDVDSQAEPYAYFLEADPAAIRAHLLPSLAQELGAATLGDSNGYLTANSFAKEAAAKVWVRGYLVVAFGHADPKRIRSELARHRGRLSAVKTRGVRETPEKWMKLCRSEGSRKLILAMYPVEKSVRFVLMEPAT